MAPQRWLRESASRPSITIIPEAIGTHLISFLNQRDAFHSRGVCWIFYKAYFDQEYLGNGIRVQVLICEGREFRKLKYMRAYWYSRFDISSLSRIPALEDLTIEIDEIYTERTVDAFPKNLVKLTKLKLECCVEDLSGINGCVSLQDLVLKHNYTFDLQTIPSTLTCLKMLSLETCGLTDLSMLAHLGRFKCLTEINLSSNEDLVLSTMPNNLNQVLKKLDLRGCNLSNVSSLDGLSYLEELDLRMNYDFEPDTLPSCLSHLRILRIGGGNLYSLTFLQCFSSLEELEIVPDNVISLMSFPYNLANLKILIMNLHTREACNLSILSRFPILAELRMDGTTDIDLGTLPTNLLNLRNLSLKECNLENRDTSVFCRLSNLCIIEI